MNKKFIFPSKSAKNARKYLLKPIICIDYREKERDKFCIGSEKGSRNQKVEKKAREDQKFYTLIIISFNDFSASTQLKRGRELCET